MENLLDRYGYVPDIEKIGRNLDVLASNLDSVVTPQVLKTRFSLMDLTTLRSNDTIPYVAKFTDKVTAYRSAYPDYPLPASICVYPNFAATVKEHRCSPELHVTVVSGCFPASQSFLEVKMKECELAVRDGADEVDIVLALNAFLAGDLESARREVRAMRECIDRTAAELGRKVVLKVIIETGLLVTPEKIAEASFLAMEEGADFIKTSTGKVEVNATPTAAYVMCECIRAFYAKTGRRVGFKAAGGISSAMDAVCYYSIVKNILGEAWLDRNYFRFGVSRLANNLLSAIEQKTVSVF